ncbi:MAG: hypothetical protein U9Q21_00200 [Candidatus Auribacterota bacterium]|nr:hypothetical protein [Candidatus Auribacterota bacterium]
MWIVIVAMLVTALIVYNTCINYLITTTQDEGVISSESIEGLNLTLIKYLIVPAVVACLVCFLLSIMISHRVAGALFRIEMYLNQMSEGKLPDEIRFRDNDVVPEIGESFNKMLAYLYEVKSGVDGLDKIMLGAEFNKEKALKKLAELKRMFPGEK